MSTFPLLTQESSDGLNGIANVGEVTLRLTSDYCSVDLSKAFSVGVLYPDVMAKALLDVPYFL